MAPSDSDSRPVYVYLLALTALLLFGVNFASYVGSKDCDVDRVVQIEVDRHPVVHARAHAPAPPASPWPELRVELERARAEMDRARKQMQATRAPSPTVVFVR